MDGTGNVFVASFDNGMVYEIPPSCVTSSCVRTVVDGLNYPEGVAVDGKGNVFVADTLNHRVVQLEAGDFGTVAVGQTSATISLTFIFDTAGTIGIPLVLTQGAPNLDFADPGTGSCTANGTGYVYNAGDTCTVDVMFTPRFAGLRRGGVVLMSGSGTAIAEAYVHGTGSGPQVSFLPGSQSKLGNGFYYPDGVAVDGSGNVFVADTANYAVKEILAAGGYVTVNTLGSGFFNPAGVAVDGSGNVFVADFGNKAVKEIFATGGYTTVNTLGGGFDGPEGIAVDESGNVFVADTMNSAVEKIPYGCLASSCVETLGSGFLYPSGVAVDAGGNVLVADPNNHMVYEILAAGGYTTVNTLGSGFQNPFGVAVDASGNVFVGDYSDSAVVRLDREDAPSLSFGSISVGANSADQTVTLQNIGNAPLILPFLSTRNNPSISQNFALDSSASTACPMVATSSTAGSLPSDSSCTLSISFDPAISGNISGSLVLTDNALNVSIATQTVGLNGTGMDFSLPASPPAITVTAGQTNTAIFTVTPIMGFTGTVSFTCSVPANVSEASCSASSVQLTGASGMNSTLTLSTTGPHQVASMKSHDHRLTAMIGTIFAGVVWLGIPVFRRRRFTMLMFALAALLALGIASSGGSGGSSSGASGYTDPGTPAGTYTLTVTATSGTATHSMSVPVTVQ